MVEHDSDRSGNPPKKLSREEEDGWDNLILKLGLEDVWESDDFTHYDSLRFSWTIKQKELSHLMARLDQFYKHQHNKENRSFRFNTSYLEDAALVKKLEAIWGEEPLPSSDFEASALWLVRAQLRIAHFCQQEGKARAKARQDRELQLRSTVASAKRIIELDLRNAVLQETLAAANQELVEKEQKAADWNAICSSARWSQIDGRTSGAFFEGVREHQTKTPIQSLVDEDSHEYNTNADMAAYANTYYNNLFSTEGCSAECEQAREFCWGQIPATVTPEMNSAHTKPLTDGLPPKFFLKIWDTLSNDLLKVFNEALRKGTLCRDLNSGLLCLIPKGGDKTNL
ncbi:hypothetical protein KC19_5G132900 [Ceratodon purpureus]|uniref:Uncharacterized protein n=1 Tax=Ceratodon purpureus TaxID=3225 RepID=A0A8T0I272_CERPU|nr:hypothetical protein KC19_5G132900 [Ceratodon purpureus]